MRLIDADALEKFLSDAEIEATRQRKYVFASALNTICGNVRNFPTIEPERKKGKWFLLDECANAGYYCSNCRKKVVKEGWSKTVKKINFCPNCGADMRGEQNE